jgi:hypothetical protein
LPSSLSGIGVCRVWFRGRAVSVGAIVAGAAFATFATSRRGGWPHGGARHRAGN